MSNAILFEENFAVGTDALDVDAKKYDRVSRVTAKSLSQDTQIQLDVNTELYPMAPNDAFTLCLASTLALDGSKDEGRSWKEVTKGESTLADHYDYVCHGKVYRFEEGEAEAMCV